MRRVPTGDSLHIKFQVIPTIGFRVIVVGSWVTFWVGFTHPLFTPKKSRFLLGRAWSRPETPLLGELSCPTSRLSWRSSYFPVLSVFWPGEQKYCSKNGIFEGFSKSNKVWRLREDRISHFLRPTVNLPYQIIMI